MTYLETAARRTLREKDDKRERVLLTVIDAEGRELAILFKGRDELPAIGFSALINGYGPIEHLGEQPRFMTGNLDCSVAYEEWRAEKGVSGGKPLLVVDATPVGLVELAYRLSGNPNLLELAEEMRAGRWSAEALALADDLVAMTCLEPGSEPTIREAMDSETQAFAGHDDMAKHALIAVLQGELTKTVQACEATSPEWFKGMRSVMDRADLPEIDDEVRGHWISRIETLAAAGRLAELPLEMDAERESESARAVHYRVRTTVGSVLSLWRERLELDIDSDGRRWFTETRDPERILVVARSLAGDADAVEQVREARSALAAHHDWRGARHEREERKEWLQIRSAPLAPDDVARVSDLVVVHTTSFPPPRSADGMVCLQTRFDATGYPRASLHFTLNHAVTSHLYGNWNDAGYVVVAPLGDAIDRNGPPENLNGVDTWWELDPGRAVVLPGAVVIQHDPNASELISRVGDTVTVKAANFTEAEIEQLMAAEVIDSDDIWGPVAVPMGAEPSSAQEVEARRTAKIAEGARKLATQRIVESMGARLATGGMWESSLERSIKPLAAELGCGAGPHCNSPTFNAEIDRYNGLEETSDPRLWLASPAVLRVVAATGFLAPRPALVRERDQVRSGPYIPLE